MRKLLKGIGSAVLRGLVWALIWGPLAVLIGLIIDPDGSMDEMWIAAGAYPGFLCGLVFTGLLALSAKRSSWSVARAATSGAMAGALVGLLPFFVASTDTSLSLGVLIIVVIVLFSTVSGVGTALWQRRRHEQAA